MYKRQLVVCGLRVYDKEHLDEPEVPTHLAVATISSQDIVPPLQEINGEKIPEFSNLTVIRDQAFKIFAKLGVKHPYPWPYPLQMWLNPDLEETEETEETGETEEISTSDIIPHGNKERFSVIREDILSACLAVLATYPSECRNSAGNITATALRECLDRNATKFWPKTGSPPQEAETIEKLINRSLNRIK